MLLVDRDGGDTGLDFTFSRYNGANNPFSRQLQRGSVYYGDRNSAYLGYEEHLKKLRNKLRTIDHTNKSPLPTFTRPTNTT